MFIRLSYFVFWHEMPFAARMPECQNTFGGVFVSLFVCPSYLLASICLYLLLSIFVCIFVCMYII